MWAAQLIDWIKPRTHITSGGAGTMGFSVPAAMGVAIAYPEDTIWAICGDGCFQMMNQEMATMIQEGIKNVKIAVINNGYLGMVRQWQELFENKRYSGTPLSGPNFAKLAEAYGWKGITVTRVEDVDAAIEEAYATDGPVLIDFQVEREVNVWPMVPQGKSIGEMITEAPAT
jgi:acetolactate synthase-1/2/3 large subunit